MDAKRWAMDGDMSGASGLAGEAGRPPLLRLDLGRNKSPNTVELLAVPQFSGGRLDPDGGYSKRIYDLKRIKALETFLRRPAILTLTIDRKRFASPEVAYDYASSLVSRLLTDRLCAKTWARVSEVQTKTGDGWIHWHIIVDLAELGPMGKVASRVWQLWRDKWAIGGCDLQRINRSVAGYVAGYVTKKWPAIPVWMGESCKRFRLVGFSKRANELIRAALGHVVKPRVETGLVRTYRKTRSLFERLAGSGLQTAIIARTASGDSYFLASVPCNVLSLPDLDPTRQFVRVLSIRRETKSGWIERAKVCFSSVADLAAARSVAKALKRSASRLRFGDRMDQIYNQRLFSIQHSWDWLEYKRGQQGRTDA